MNQAPPTDIQEAFLDQICRKKIPVTVYLINGFQIRGVLAGFDHFTLLVNQEQKQQIIYKHAVSTISPQDMAVILADN